MGQISGGLYVLVHQIGQPQVGDRMRGCARPARSGLPSSGAPLHDISGKELLPGMKKYLPARHLRMQVEKRQHVLQLVAIPVAAASLVGAGSAPTGGRQAPGREASSFTMRSKPGSLVSILVADRVSAHQRSVFLTTGLRFPEDHG